MLWFQKSGMTYISLKAFSGEHLELHRRHVFWSDLRDHLPTWPLISVSRSSLVLPGLRRLTRREQAPEASRQHPLSLFCVSAL